jgi:signal transduction histidine kinase
MTDVHEQLRFFQAVSQAVNSSLILEDIFEALGEVLYEFIPYEEAVIVILDESQNGIKTLVRISSDGSLELSGEHHAFAGYEPLVDRVLRDARPYRLNREESQSGLFTIPPSAALLVPLINKGVVIGLLALSANENDTENAAFSTKQELLLSEVSHQLAVAVENARLYWQTQSQAGREFLINQLTRSVRQSLEIDVILGTAVRELGKVLGVSRCFICYFPSALKTTFADQVTLKEITSQESNYLNSPEQSQSSLSKEEAVKTKVFAYQLPSIPALSIQQPEDLAEYNIFEKRQQNRYNPFILNDTRDCPEAWMSQETLARCQLKSLAVIPILLQETLVGIISLHQCDAYRSWVAEDITLLSAMAEHLGVALQQATLFETLDQRTHDLENTLEELQQAQLYLIQSEKMAVLGQFVAGIAHEVNTPLGTMMSNNNTLATCFQQLKENALVSPSENEQRVIQGMDRLFSLNTLAGSRIQEIVRNLRNFARLDESELKTVNLHEGIDSTLLLLESSIDRRIQIIREYDPNFPPLQCFPGLLNQVFMNLVVNAGHAIVERLESTDPSMQSDPKSMSITIHSEWVADSQTALIRIQDTGKGIAPENLKKVFDPGFTTKGVGVGTGLGLALCYRIIEKHGGRITVDSELGKGAYFTVHLPKKSKP